MDHRKEAAAIRASRPQTLLLNPPPLPYQGHINLIRRHDGGYLIAAVGYDDQAGVFDDGGLAAEVIGAQDVEAEEPRDLLAEALLRAQQRLERLRFEASLRLVAELGSDQEEGQLVEALRLAIQRRREEQER
jgi:hypothetical protein